MSDKRSRHTNSSSSADQADRPPHSREQARRAGPGAAGGSASQSPRTVTRDIPADEWPFDALREQVCFVIVKAREFDVKEGSADPVEDSNGGSNAADDRMAEVLEDTPDDPVRAELAGFIGEMNEDAQIDLVALAWIGRGDGERGDWAELREQAAARHNEGRGVARYLLGLPLLADYLEEGLAQFGQSCVDLEAEHL